MLLKELKSQIFLSDTTTCFKVFQLTKINATNNIFQQMATHRQNVSYDGVTDFMHVSTEKAV